MTDSTSYIIVPPEESGGGFSLQDLIEGLQSGRLVIGNDNVLVSAQQQEETDAGQQVILTLPEQPENDGTGAVVDSVQDASQVNQNLLLRLYRNSLQISVPEKALARSPWQSETCSGHSTLLRTPPRATSDLKFQTQV